MLECCDHVRRYERALVGRDGVERIEADGEGKIRRIEVDDALRDAGGRRRVRDRHGEIAVGVEEGKAVARLQIGPHEIEQKGRFSRARLADHVQMPAQVAARKKDRRIQIEPDGCGPQLLAIGFLGHGSPSEPGSLAQSGARVMALLVCGAAKPGAGGGR